MMDLRDKAERFRSLHGDLLILPNAWDVASALVIEEAGATAIATTSSGVAWSLGAPDGDHLDRDSALDLIGKIASAVRVPVTADIEGGYAPDAAGVGETIRGVLAAGAVGVNLEDGTRPVAEVCERIAAARQAADAEGVPLYINARTDTYLRALGDEETRLEETLARAKSYVDAGASGIFVPGVVDRETVSALASGISAPLNVLVRPGAPSARELGEWGSARVSIGGGIAEAAYGLARRAAAEMLTDGTYTSLTGALTYGELNELLSRARVL